MRFWGFPIHNCHFGRGGPPIPYIYLLYSKKKKYAKWISGICGLWLGKGWKLWSVGGGRGFLVELRNFVVGRVFAPRGGQALGGR